MLNAQPVIGQLDSYLIPDWLFHGSRIAAVPPPVPAQPDDVRSGQSMMAAERGGGPGSSGPDYSVLVVVGALQTADLLERLLRQVEAGE